MDESKDKNKQYELKPEPGVFVTKGMRISIPQLTISLKPDGQLDADPITLHTEIDLCPFWLEIAFEHLLATENANTTLLTAIKEQNDEEIGIALENEFLAGMQAIMSSVIAIESFSENIKDRIDFPNELNETWKKNKTAKYKRVSEVLRLAFNFNNEVTKKLRDALKQNFHFRDIAVHPSSGTKLPSFHPELNKATDWRYVTFRFYNAKEIVGLSIKIIAQISGLQKKITNKDLKKYCMDLSKKVDPLAERWKENYEKSSVSKSNK